MAKQSLRGKTAVITGAGSGIGRGLASVLSQRGCQLAICDIDSAGLAETAAGLDGDVYTEVVDVADREAVFAYAENVNRRFGAADLVINNAGVDLAQPLADVGFDDFEWLININFWGVVYGTKAFLPDMLARDSGMIVNISSVFGIVAWPSQGSYCASKFAVRGFTEALRHELEGTGVKTLSVHPGAVATNIVRNARFYADEGGGSDKEVLIKEFAKIARTTPLEAAEQIVRAMENGKERVLPGDGGRLLDWLQRLMPVSYYRALAKLGGLGSKRKTEPTKPDDASTSELG